MKLEGNPWLIIWALWLLIDGLVVAGIAVRQFQLWRRAQPGDRLPSLLLFLIMAGWSLGGFVGLAALASLGALELPSLYTFLMLVARTFGTAPLWLWLGMLVGAIRERPCTMTERIVASGERSVDEWEQRIRRIVREEIDRPFKEEE